MNLLRLSLILLSGLLAACGGGGDGGTTGSGDPCGNAIGNGNTLISGPTAPDGISNFDSPFRSLIVHPQMPSTIYVGTEENGILRSEDSGVTWERLRLGLRHSGSAYPEVYDLAISASSPDVLYAATTAGPGSPQGTDAPSIGGIYKSVDGGDTWTRKNCGLPTASASSVYVSPSDESVALVGLAAGETTTTGPIAFYAGGVFRTIDGGENWSRADLSMLDDINIYYQLVGRETTQVYTFGLGYDDLANNAGFFTSPDTGENWSAVTTPFTQLRIAYLTVSADGQRIIFNELDSFELQVSEDGGSTWGDNNLVSANGPVRISPHNKDLIVIGSNQDLWVSDDGLLTATQVVNNAIDFFQDIEFSPSNSQVIYAVTRGYHLYGSDDGGQSFQFIIDLRTDIINTTP